jgi:hypothetical protein
MNVIDKFLDKYSYRFPKGYPDLTDPADKKLMQELLSEIGVDEQEDIYEEEEVVSGEPMESITNNELTDLENIFKNENFRIDYKKYLTLFHYFSPNALGEISEVIITNLINKYGNGIGAIHTGGSQGLDDIKLKDGTKISLKTTKSNTPIGLGSNIEAEAEGDNNEIINYFRGEFPNEKGKFDVGVLKNISNKEIKNLLDKKINAIIQKLSGSGKEKELFVWVEKIFTKSSNNDSILSSLKIHTFDFNSNEVKEKLENGTLNITGKGAWGIKDSITGKPLINADKGKGKTLNINPNFISSMYKEVKDPDPIVIIEPSEINNIENTKANVNQNIFSALDKVYDAVFPKGSI